MTSVCIACGHSDFEHKPYPCPPGPRTARRIILDIIQRIGWSVLPLERLPVRNARRFAQGLFKFRSVRRCLGCGLGVIVPMPDQHALNRYYRNFYVDALLSGLPPIEPRGVSQAWHIGRVINLSTISSSFEFGAGSASLSRSLVADAPNIRATVVELSNEALAVLRTEPAIHEAVSIYDGPDAAFGLVMASHALEHVVDPVETLRDWYRQLHPGGYLFVEVPNADSDHYAVDHEYIPHTWFFTASSLDRLARAVGFRTLSIQTGGLTYRDAIAAYPQPAPDTWSQTGAAGSQLRGIWQKPAQ